jgi:aryl-alcohol dehydrogenase-like predicted oxidoreductase
VLSYSPLGGGLLTGKYGVGKRPEHGRLVENAMYGVRYGDEAYYDAADRFSALARELGVHPATLAVSWVLHTPGVTAPIIGARDVAQLEASLAAESYPMTDELYTRIAELSPAPPPATDRTEERRGVRYKGSVEKY